MQTLLFDVAAVSRDWQLERQVWQKALHGHGVCHGLPPAASDTATSAVWRIHALLLSSTGVSSNIPVSAHTAASAV